MNSWLSKLLGGHAGRAPIPRRPLRLEVETLEERCTPAVTYHGGAVLPHVEAQAIFLGSDWVSNPTYAQQAHYLDGFVHTIVNSSYMDMLTNAGYNVGRGSASAAATDPVHLDKSTMLSDAAIRTYLQLAVNAHIVQPPDANRLYLIFVEDNVSVGIADGSTSLADYLSYHGAFTGLTATGQPAYIRYAVVPYPGGTVGNQSVPGLSAVQSVTECTSHEIADAVTDPDVNFAAAGWYDDTLKDGPLADEAAQVVNREYVTLDGYVVQRVADKNDQGMTPAGATPLRAVSFDLLTSGRLYEHTSTGWSYLRVGVASISSQSIDNNGAAIVDVVLTNGDAYEYHDGGGWVFLAHNVKQACADQGVSYVLGTNGQVRQYNDASSTWSGTLAANVVSIDAGTDRYGADMVDGITTAGAFIEYSDSFGLHTWCGNAAAVSAGMDGVSLVLLKNGTACEFSELAGGFTHLANGIAKVAAGTDPNGAAMFDLISTTGVLTEYRTGTGWKTLATGVATVGKARGGLVDVVYANGTAYQHTASGWTLTTTGVRDGAERRACCRWCSARSASGVRRACTPLAERAEHHRQQLLPVAAHVSSRCWTPPRRRRSSPWP